MRADPIDRVLPSLDPAPPHTAADSERGEAALARILGSGASGSGDADMVAPAVRRRGRLAPLAAAAVVTALVIGGVTLATRDPDPPTGPTQPPTTSRALTPAERSAVLSTCAARVGSAHAIDGPIRAPQFVAGQLRDGWIWALVRDVIGVPGYCILAAGDIADREAPMVVQVVDLAPASAAQAAASDRDGITVGRVEAIPRQPGGSPRPPARRVLLFDAAVGSAVRAAGLTTAAGRQLEFTLVGRRAFAWLVDPTAAERNAPGTVRLTLADGSQLSVREDDPSLRRGDDVGPTDPAFVPDLLTGRRATDAGRRCRTTFAGTPQERALADAPVVAVQERDGMLFTVIGTEAEAGWCFFPVAALDDPGMDAASGPLAMTPGDGALPPAADDISDIDGLTGAGSLGDRAKGWPAWELSVHEGLAGRDVAAVAVHTPIGRQVAVKVGPKFVTWWPEELGSPVPSGYELLLRDGGVKRVTK